MINDRVRDNGLTVLTTECDLFVLCSEEPTTFAQANQLLGGDPAGFRLGSKAPTITLDDGQVDGRRAVLSAFSDGTVEATGGGSSGMWWACLDTANSRLLSTGELTNDQVVTDGNTFSMSATDVAIFRD